jgi:large subunit ribosomal protein L19
MSDLVRSLEFENMMARPKEVPIEALRPGATVKVNFRIVEGRRERVQPFQGVIIRVRPGLASANITVRRIGAHGIGVERTFPLHSPRLESIQVMRQGHVRRANLYFLRQRTGKATRLREKRRLRVAMGDTGAPESFPEE